MAFLKRGGTIIPGIVGLIYVIIGVIPFLDKFGITSIGLDIPGLFLKFLLAVAGVIIFFTSFRIGIGIHRFFYVILGFVFAAFGIFLVAVHYGLIASGFELPLIVLQVLVLVYGLDLLYDCYKSYKIYKT